MMLLVGVAIAVGGAGWLRGSLLLADAAELWVVSDPLGPADAVVVLGGGLDTRPVAAATYYQQGLIGKILLSNVRSTRAERLGLVPSHMELNRRVLLQLGVPETAIESFGSGLSNTYEEAVALNEWAMKTHAHAVIVPTEQFSSRRVRWILARELATSGVVVRVPAVDDPAYSSSHWWKDEKGLVAFQNEVLKYIYYRLKY
jgi:uncharacterized SAM-binding protein YcdF (DUF218 family)